MSTLAQGLRTVLVLTTFFAMVYFTYLCTYIAPTRDLRRWGANTSWLLSLFGPAWHAEAIRIDNTVELGDHPPISAAGSRGWRA